MTTSGPSKPIPDEANRLAQFVENHLGEQLRSIVWYDQGDFEILYGREDVMDEYTSEEVDDVVDELALEARETAIKESLYTHGSLACTVRCFEGGIEMHFIVGEGEGVAVGLDPAAFVTHDTFLGRCLEEADAAD